MSPPNNLRYVTGDGGPPNGGRAPGMPLPPRYRVVSPAPPPPYTPQPPTVVQTVVHQYPVYVSQPQMTVARVVNPLVIQGPPVVTVPAVSVPPTPLPERPSVPGETLDGKKVLFDDGSSYLFPKDYTTFHLVAKDHRPWENPGKEFHFTTHKVPCTTTVRELVSLLGVPVTSTNKLGIAECLESGGGVWKRGTTFVPIDKDYEITKIRTRLGGDTKGYSDGALAGLLPDDRCDETIKQVGWSEKAGKSKKPIWLAVYQA